MSDLLNLMYKARMQVLLLMETLHKELSQVGKHRFPDKASFKSKLTIVPKAKRPIGTLP